MTSYGKNDNVPPGRTEGGKFLTFLTS